MFPAKRWEGNWTGKYSRGNVRKSKWGGYYKSLWIKLPWSTNYISWIARTLFPVESTVNIKIKITHHGFTGDQSILRGTSVMNACWVSQSVFYQVLNAVSSDCVFKRKFLMEK